MCQSIHLKLKQKYEDYTGKQFDKMCFLKAFIEMFELSREDGVYLTDIKNIPCRLVFDGDKCVGFGHFMKDKFVLTEEFAKIYT